MKFFPIFIFVLITLTTLGQDTKSPSTFVEKMPEFPGGESALSKFLSTNIRYPAKANENHITGTVVVRFIVEKDGSIDSIRILKSVGGGCDEEVLRVLSKMPKWSPGTLSGDPVPVYFNLPVTFSLEEEVPEDGNAQFASTKYKDMMEYMKYNLHYPADVIKDKRGNVTVRFTVTRKGKIKDALIVSSFSSSFDKEALKMVKNMPKWMPAIKKGHAVDSEVTLQIAYAPD